MYLDIAQDSYVPIVVSSRENTFDLMSLNSAKVGWLDRRVLNALLLFVIKLVLGEGLPLAAVVYNELGE